MSSKPAFNIGQKAVLCFMGLCLVGMLIASVAYRIDHPSLTEKRGTGSQAQADAMMSRISGLMQRIQDNPDDVEAMQQLGHMFMSMRAWDRAARFWERVLEHRPQDSHARKQLAMCFYQQQRYQEAARQLKQVLSRASGDHYARFNLGVLLIHFLDQPAQGKAYVRQVAEAESADEELRQKARQELSDLKAPPDEASQQPGTRHDGQ
jgi:tetratricopeptide (TPR) repeat protein